MLFWLIIAQADILCREKRHSWRYCWFRVEIFYFPGEPSNHAYRRDCRKTLNQIFCETQVVDFTTCEFTKIETFWLFRQPRKEWWRDWEVYLSEIFSFGTSCEAWGKETRSNLVSIKIFHGNCQQTQGDWKVGLCCLSSGIASRKCRCGRRVVGRPEKNQLKNRVFWIHLFESGVDDFSGNGLPSG